MRDFKVS